MIFATQYYRPPFPNAKYWDDDLARMKDAGLNALQLWVVWGWIEPAPGRFEFGDYDRLVELADKHGLGVIMSLIADVQPLWIHDAVPDSHLITHTGRKCLPGGRIECHFGVVPGGCTDHPEVWRRMAGGIAKVVERYRGASHLRGWDEWNENRWNVHADDLVCYCPHTVGAYRGWLKGKFGSLEGLNKAWERRYTAWEQVEPGRKHLRPYTELMSFQHFLTWRADQHAKARYEVIKSIDEKHPVVLHPPCPTPYLLGGPQDQALNRGNDWFIADHLDGIGTSAFPVWGNMDAEDFIARLVCTKSAARGKRAWLSELQGGRHSWGFDLGKPVDAASQQGWIWKAMATGMEASIFWCWRDEVFTSEAGGFGFAGQDEFAAARAAAMQLTARVYKENEVLLRGYKPQQPRVGVLFSPQTYYLHWGFDATAGKAGEAFIGYLRGIIRQSIPVMVVEERHLEVLAGLRVLFMPRTLVVDEDTAAALRKWAEAGGVLVCESECGAFDSRGIYRYPADRFVGALTGCPEVGRRSPASRTVSVTLNGQKLDLPITAWTTALDVRRRADAKVLATNEHGPMVVETPVGRGRVIQCGVYLGEIFQRNWNASFEAFLTAVVESAGLSPTAKVLEPKPKYDRMVWVRSGESGGKRMLFVFLPNGAERARVALNAELAGVACWRELMTGRELRPAGNELTVEGLPYGIAAMVEV